MKIRNGFVSNSSSSSFAIFGISIDPFEEIDTEDEDDIGNNADQVDDILGDLDLCYSGPEFYDCNKDVEDSFYIIGRSPEAMLEGQTLSEFKQQIADDLNTAFKSRNLEITREQIKFYHGIIPS
jgi:hypothetical protein